VSVGPHLLNIDDRPIGNAAHAIQPLPPRPLRFIEALGLPAQQEVSAQQRARTPPRVKCRDELDS
jgi:hypothetical protein